MLNRRKFLKRGGAAGMYLSFAGIPSGILSDDVKKLTILHTNDTHSQLEPFDANHSKYPNMGGMAARAVLVEQIRKEEKNVLLLDAGDIFQGTAFFNIYGGELSFKLMSMLNYDAATMGNHDLDNGIEGFDTQLKHCNFPFLVCNYDFANTSLKGKVDSYKIFNFDGIKIGITGVGIELEGLVDPKNYGEIIYQDPVASANMQAKMLKEDLGCNYVIVLSHLGYKSRKGSKKVKDVVLAEKSENIDLIIGGHSHTFLDEPDLKRNKVGKEVAIVQAGFAGIKLGRLDLYFSQKKEAELVAFNSLDVRDEAQLG